MGHSTCAKCGSILVFGFCSKCAAALRAKPIAPPVRGLAKNYQRFFYAYSNNSNHAKGKIPAKTAFRAGVENAFLKLCECGMIPPHLEVIAQQHLEQIME